MSKTSTISPTIGHGSKTYVMLARIICEDEVLQEGELTVEANQRSVAIHRAEQYVHECWEMADARIDYRVQIIGTQEVS